MKTFLLFILGLAIGGAIAQYHFTGSLWSNNPKDILLATELKNVDNAKNGIRRISDGEKQYILMRYLGKCTADDKLDIKTSSC